MKSTQKLISLINISLLSLFIASCSTKTMNNETLYLTSDKMIFDESSINILKIDEKEDFLEYFNNICLLDSEIKNDDILNELIQSKTYLAYKVALIEIRSTYGEREVNLSSINYSNYVCSLEFNYRNIKNAEYGSLDIKYHYFFLKLENDTSKISVNVDDNRRVESLEYSY